MIQKMQSIKNFTKNSFDRAILYESHTPIQKEIAHLISLNIGSEYFESVLEVGAGTGHLTQCVTIGFNNYTCIDISDKALNRLKSKLKNRNGFDFITDDVENYDFSGKQFDLILSSSSIQWLLYPEKTLKKFIYLLKDMGQIHFGVFIEPTFKEMQLTSIFSGFGSTLKLKDERFYLDIFKDLNLIYKYVCTKKLYFQNPIEFLRFHKASGARFTNFNSLCPKEKFKKFCDFYEKNFKTKDRIYTTYSYLIAGFYK
ncbi:Methyltransferase type 12 [Thermodesulfobium narugense DSM 14796]|uniref:Methyltransferase type 12 n=1 Tax=Thermodesulfobium narugense DSM 14796 TaxID=747365 RepID=M1E9K4_9BACT|nr:methyltransferase domain-containing protein [Thermodesulfobium narugense]AEE15434.1 Methyltransferase type 12 [Thermodesulfobium narugense DSM 14796]